MSRTFSITLTAEERFAILVGMGWLWKTVENSPDAITKPIAVLIDKLTSTPGQDALTVDETRRMGQQKDDSRMVNEASTGTGQARAILSPPAPTDHFARDRKGNVPSSAPKGAELQNHKLVGFAKTTTFLPQGGARKQGHRQLFRFPALAHDREARRPGAWPVAPEICGREVLECRRGAGMSRPRGNNISARTRRILSRLKAGEKQSAIAKSEGVSRNRVWQLRQNLEHGYYEAKVDR